MRSAIKQLLLALPLLTVTVLADRAAHGAQSEAMRPRICLVLSGGGARGAAHVGVIKALEALRVPVDCIAGTSMGAVVGATYASGRTVPEMETMLGGLTTEALFRERLPRQEQSPRRKQEDYSNLIGPEIGYRNGELLLPKGVITAVRLEAVLRRLAGRRDSGPFDRLPIPFRAVATDLTTGEQAVFADGDLVNAMRASMSVPGVVAPAEFDDRIYVDGGIANNLPVDVARAMGADIVIAVNLGTSLLKREALGSLFGATTQMMNILTEQNVRASLAALRPTDILIEPELGEFSFADFDHMAKTVPIGEAAVRKVAPRLAALALDAPAFALHRDRQQATRATAPRAIDEVRFGGLRRVNPRYTAWLMDHATGGPLDDDRLDRDLLRLHGTGDFERVGYRVFEEQGRGILAVDAVEKSWGPDYLRFGLGLSSDFRGDAYYNLQVRHRRTWLNALGAEWRNDLQFGRVDRLLSEWYQPLTDAQTVFAAPYGQLERRTIDIYERDLRVARYDARTALAGVDIGAQSARLGEARLGAFFGRARGVLDTGSTLISPPEVGASLAAARLRLVADQLDSVIFPREGHAASVTLTGSRRSMGADATYNRWDTDGVFVRSAGVHTLNVGYRFGGRSGPANLPAYDLFQWGGLLQQSGYRTGALLGESIAFGRVMYYQRLSQQTLLEGVYAGASFEVGRVGRPLVQGSPTGVLHSGAVFVAFDTPLGPLYLAYGRTSDGLSSYYLYLGRF